MNDVVWTPTHIEKTNLWRFMRELESRYQQTFADYPALHAWSIKEPALFWQALCDYFGIRFDNHSAPVLEHANDMINARWFPGRMLNIVHYFLARKDDHPALISIDERGNRRVLSYKALRNQVAQCAEGLKQAGIKAHDRVAAIMPNVDYTIIAMLATASLGAIWSSCSPDFGAEAIVDRLGQVEPTLLFVTDGHPYHGKIHPAFDKIKYIQTRLPSVKQLVLCPVIHDNNALTLPNTVAWEAFLKPASTLNIEATFPFDHPLYILFSSGTTGKPKCIIHGAGGTLLQHLKELGLHTDIKPTDNLCFYTTCGWMMWNWMVSTLALGATLTLYEGSPTFPDAETLFRLIDNENVTVFGTSAKFISTIEKEGVIPNRHHSLPHLRTILSTGSPLLPAHYDFVYQHIKKDVQLSSISGGTDIVSCFALGNPLLPVYRGELQCLGLGMNVDVFDEAGHSIRGVRGELVCKTPFPSMPIGFWHDDHKLKYHQAYFERFPNVWTHGDFAELTTHGGLIIHGRSDTVLNPGGVRIGTAEIYRQLAALPEIVDSVVIGQDWQDDVRIVLFVKLRDNLALTDALETTIRQTLRNHASPRHVPAKILDVPDIPRTINGKIVEIAVRDAVHGRPINNLASIINPDALAFFKNRAELKQA